MYAILHSCFLCSLISTDTVLLIVYAEWLEHLKGRHNSEDSDVDGRIILKWILKKRESVDWIQLAQDRGQWRATVYTIMNLRAP
jgi:hypothetical protein